MFDDVWLKVGNGEGCTFPVIASRKRIDYIWLSKGSALEPLKAWVPYSEASDHLPVVVELRFR